MQQRPIAIARGAIYLLIDCSVQVYHHTTLTQQLAIDLDAERRAANRAATASSSDGVDAAGESANQGKYAFLEKALAESRSPFKVCVWHMNMENMQVSYKGDSTGWGAFEICRKHGAFVVNGHAHTYSRTKEMARFGEKKWSHTKEDLRVAEAVRRGEQDANVVNLRRGENGSTATAVVGFGGYRNEPQLKQAPHWAKVYSSSCLSGDGACAPPPSCASLSRTTVSFDNKSVACVYASTPPPHSAATFS
mgnify:CR=1 FL=1